MSERGVCICPECGCQFSDPAKVGLERAVLSACERYAELTIWDQHMRAVLARIATSQGIPISRFDSPGDIVDLLKGKLNA